VVHARWSQQSVRSGFRAKTAHKIDDKADQQNQAEPSAADGGPAKVKAAAAEQEEKNNNEKEEVHGDKIARRGECCYGALPHRSPATTAIETSPGNPNLESRNPKLRTRNLERQSKISGPFRKHRCSNGVETQSAQTLESRPQRIASVFVASFELRALCDEKSCLENKILRVERLDLKTL